MMIDYKLFIKSSEYANAYFLLRTYAKKQDRSYPLKPLDVQTVLKLQKRLEDTNSVKPEVLLRSV